MYTIQANPSGTRSIEVSNENLRTIEKYALFRHLIDSTGIVDEAVLDKLKLNIRSLIASQEEDSKDLLDLCIDVIYHNNMKHSVCNSSSSSILPGFPTQKRKKRRNNDYGRYLRNNSIQSADSCNKSNVHCLSGRNDRDYHEPR